MTREQLLERYSKIKELDNQISKAQSQRQELLQKHRLECVDYVLYNVRRFARNGKMSTHDIDAYLCHCQNKLNGNIDGIILDFSRYSKEDNQ